MCTYNNNTVNNTISTVNNKIRKDFQIQHHLRSNVKQMLVCASLINCLEMNLFMKKYYILLQDQVREFHIHGSIHTINI